MALVKLNPIMTSNNTPAPYKCWASSEWSTGLFPAWKAFDGSTEASSYWHVSGSGNDVRSGYLYFDFGEPILVSNFEIYPGNEGSYIPAYVTIYGTNEDGTDDSKFELIQSYSGGAYNPTQIFTITAPKKYRVYKIYVAKNSGYNMSVQELTFYIDNEKYKQSFKDRIKETILGNEYLNNVVTYDIEE